MYSLMKSANPFPLFCGVVMVWVGSLFLKRSSEKIHSDGSYWAAACGITCAKNVLIQCDNSVTLVL